MGFGVPEGTGGGDGLIRAGANDMSASCKAERTSRSPNGSAAVRRRCDELRRAPRDRLDRQHGPHVGAEECRTRSQGLERRKSRYELRRVVRPATRSPTETTAHCPHSVQETTARTAQAAASQRATSKLPSTAGRNSRKSIAARCCRSSRLTSYDAPSLSRRSLGAAWSRGRVRERSSSAAGRSYLTYAATGADGCAFRRARCGGRFQPTSSPRQGPCGRCDTTGMRVRSSDRASRAPEVVIDAMARCARANMRSAIDRKAQTGCSTRLLPSQCRSPTAVARMSRVIRRGESASASLSWPTRRASVT